MTTVTQTTLTDDIDGSTDDVDTCAFGLGESLLEIDLNTCHREGLEGVLTKFVESARQIRGTMPARRKQAPPFRLSREHTIAVRVWAKEQGFRVSERGRSARMCRNPQPSRIEQV